MSPKHCSLGKGISYILHSLLPEEEIPEWNASEQLRGIISHPVCVHHIKNNHDAAVAAAAVVTSGRSSTDPLFPPAQKERTVDRVCRHDNTPRTCRRCRHDYKTKLKNKAACWVKRRSSECLNPAPPGRRIRACGRIAGTWTCVLWAAVAAAACCRSSQVVEECAAGEGQTVQVRVSSVVTW